MRRILTRALGFVLVAYAARRFWLRVRAVHGQREMLPDRFGNYDLDGVSYDPLDYRVVVSGDGHIPKTETEMASEEEIRRLLEIEDAHRRVV